MSAAAGVLGVAQEELFPEWIELLERASERRFNPDVGRG
jgi:hypothetical protein